MKKSFMIITVILLAVLLPLTACGGGSEPSGLGDIQVGNPSTEAPKDEAPADAPADVPVLSDGNLEVKDFSDMRTEQDLARMYAAVFANEPHDQLLNFWGGMEKYGLRWVFGFYDVDGNGIEELLIGMAALESEYVPGIFIKQIWTLVNGNAVLLIEDWGEGESEGLYLANGDMIGTMQFGGDEYYGFFKIREGQYIERVATLYAGQPYDPKTYSTYGDVEYYYVEGPVPGLGFGDGKKMSSNDFYILLDQYGKDNNAQYITNWYYMPDRQIGSTGRSVFPVSSSSSVKVPMGNVKYDPELTQDGDPDTAWCEGVNGAGIGEWIEFQANSPKSVIGFSVANGYYKYAYDEKISDYKSLYFYNNAVKKLSVTMNGAMQTFTLPWSNYSRYWTVYLKDEVITDTIRFTIEDVYYGSKSGRSGADDKDTLISEIEVYY